MTYGFRKAYRPGTDSKLPAISLAAALSLLVDTDCRIQNFGKAAAIISDLQTHFHPTNDELLVKNQTCEYDKNTELRPLFPSNFVQIDLEIRTQLRNAALSKLPSTTPLAGSLKLSII